ncbi:MAG: three-Cys-motif partner protein TcmP [Elusimicrobia bacterium]|nr:three-Cys-motif partner protein TcmP [Elusimicrobiota bacterium]
MSETPELPDLDEVQYVESPVDKLPARVVGDWSEDKHYYLNHYINIFETGMHKKWASRAYIDLFSGPGVCMSREARRVTDGSPLIALKADYPFTDYYFSDLNATVVKALKRRCEPFGSKPGIRINIFQKDSNAVASEVAAMIDAKTLCLAFIDPTGLDFKFDALRALTGGKKMDLIIHFPIGTAIKRNIEKWFKKDQSKMDAFFAGSEWRGIYEGNQGNLTNLTSGLLGLYRAKLAQIGYAMEPADAVQIRNSKNVPLYALLFASKNPRGNQFWKKIKQIESKGQRSLPFD